MGFYRSAALLKKLLCFFCVCADLLFINLYFIFMFSIPCLCNNHLLTVLAKQAEQKAQEEEEVSRGKKRKGRKDGEVCITKPMINISFGTASPLLSRPASTVSSFTSEMNGDASEMGDMVESVDGMDPTIDEASKSEGGPVHKKVKMLAPLGGRGKMVKKRMSSSRSAAASAGAMAGALAASNAAYAVYPSYVPPVGGANHVPPSPLPTVSLTLSSHGKEPVGDESCNGDY